MQQDSKARLKDGLLDMGANDMAVEDLDALLLDSRSDSQNRIASSE